mmetsp:Transcript_14682/g.49252  ORF Transcript_14682/g.49252 Transcript_14682/m.49252 type:complete len:203 (+) Transcript_14682:106-714(+)
MCRRSAWLGCLETGGVADSLCRLRGAKAFATSHVRRYSTAASTPCASCEQKTSCRAYVSSSKVRDGPIACAALSISSPWRTSSPLEVRTRNGSKVMGTPACCPLSKAASAALTPRQNPTVTGTLYSTLEASQANWLKNCSAQAQGPPASESSVSLDQTRRRTKAWGSSLRSSLCKGVVSQPHPRNGELKTKPTKAASPRARK